MTVLVFPGSPVNGLLYPNPAIPGVNQYKYNAAASTWELVETGGTPIEVAPNVGLTLTDYVLSTQYNTLIDSAEVSVPVGGAPSLPASDWKLKNLVQVLDTILFPELLPTYTIPVATLTYSQSGLKEAGSPLAQSLTITTRKNDAGAFSSLALRRNGSTVSSISSPTGSPYPNLPDQFGYADPNNPNYTYSLSYTDSAPTTLGTTTWDATGSFLAGLPKKTSKNTTDTRPPALLSVNAPQSSGSLTTGSTTVTGIYPYFWGKTSSAPTASSIAATIAAGGATKVILPSDGMIEATFDALSEYIWFAHPATYTTKTKWYNTLFNQGEISPTSFISPPLTQAVTSPQGYWSGINYKIYISNYPSNTTGSIQLLNS